MIDLFKEGAVSMNIKNEDSMDDFYAQCNSVALAMFVSDNLFSRNFVFYLDRIRVRAAVQILSSWNQQVPLLVSHGLKSPYS